MTNDSDSSGPPWLPYSTFRTAIETLQQGLPPRLDRSVWPSQSGTIQSQLLKAFRFLKLTGENDEILPILEKLVVMPDERREIMAQLLIDAYPKVIDLAAANGSTQQLHDAFTAMGVTGDTRRKAETFFLQAGEEAGLRLSSYWPATKKRASANKTPRRSGTRSGTRATPRSARRAPSPGRNTPTPPAPTSGNIKSVDLASGGTITLAVDVDWLNVSADDRKYVLEIIDKLNEYPELLVI